MGQSQIFSRAVRRQKPHCKRRGFYVVQKSFIAIMVARKIRGLQQTTCISANPILTLRQCKPSQITQVTQLQIDVYYIRGPRVRKHSIQFNKHPLPTLLYSPHPPLLLAVECTSWLRWLQIQTNTNFRTHVTSLPRQAGLKPCIRTGWKQMERGGITIFELCDQFTSKCCGLIYGALEFWFWPPHVLQIYTRSHGIWLHHYKYETSIFYQDSVFSSFCHNKTANPPKRY